MIVGWKEDPLNSYPIDLLEKYIALYNKCTS